MGSLLKVHYTAVDAKTGKRVSRRSKRWYVQYFDHCRKKWVRKAAYTDKLASQKMLARLEEQTAREAEGIFDHLSQSLVRPIGEHAKEFKAHIENRGATLTHARTTHNRIVRVCREGGIDSVQNLSPSRVDAALAKIVADGGSLSTRNHHLNAMKMFTAWLVSERPRRAADDPLSAMKLRSTAGHETIQRRALTEDELAKLISTAAAGQPFDDVTGVDRSALYVAAAYTGLRRLELASLTPESFHIGDESYVEVLAGSSKRRRKDRIPLGRELSEFFKQFICRRKPGQAIWPVGDKKTAEMVRSDLAAAGIASQSAGSPPIVVDFHSLRVTFVTRLARMGVAPSLVQQLARHSTIDLTMNVYAKMTPDEQRQAVESLPSLAQTVAQPLAQATTGPCRNLPQPAARIKGHRSTQKAKKPR